MEKRRATDPGQRNRVLLRWFAAVWMVLFVDLPGAALGDSLTAELSYPTAGSTITDPTQPFRWTAVASAQSYLLVVGTAAGQADVWISGDVSETSVLVPRALPKGPLLYARVWTKVQGILRHSSDAPFTVVEPTMKAPERPKIASGPPLPPISRPGSWELLTEHAAFCPRDTAEDFLYDGKIWLSNGWDSDTDPIRDLWNSTDGTTWTLVGETMPYDPYSEMVVFDGKIWAIKSSVWNSTDGITWTKVLAQTPFGDRPYGKVVVYDRKMWQLGSGRDVWYSTDGVEWICATQDAGYGYRHASAVTVFNGKIWLMGGDTWDFPNTPPELFYPLVLTHNDVWCSADGTHWDRVLEEAPWAPRMWSVPKVYLGRIWIFGGFDNRHADNFGDVWYTEDGINWDPLLAQPTFSPRHDPTVFLYDDQLYLTAGNAWPVVNDVWRLSLRSLPLLMKR